MTAEKIWEITMTLIDEVPINETFDVNSTADYKAKTPYLLNAIQTELLPMTDYFKTTTYSRKPVTPMLGSKEIKEHNTEDISYSIGGNVMAYTFDVDGPCTVYIEDYTDTWNVLETINVPTTITAFTNYKGKVTPTAGATDSRIRFSGSYFYNYTNYALYKENFYGIVPEYRELISVSLPTDYDELEEIAFDKGNCFYQFEGKNLYIPYDFEGNIRIVYRPILTMITSITDTLELDTNICRTVIPYGLGAKLMLNENSAIASYLESKYNELKQTLQKRRPAERTEIIDYYGADMDF